MTNQRAKNLFSEAETLVLAGKNAESESFSRACRYYDTALTKLRTITTGCPSSRIASQLTRGQLKIGPYTMTELSVQIIPRMRTRRGAERDPMLCALFLAETADSRSVKDDLLSQIAIRYAEDGDLKNATARIREIEQAFTKTAALSRMATIVAEGANPDGARSLLSEAHGVSEEIKSGVFRDLMLSQIVEGYTSLGDYGTAFEVATEIGYMSVRALAVAKIAAGYVRNGLDDQALQLLSRIKEESERRYAEFLESDQDVEELDESSADSLGIPPGAAFSLRVLALDMGRFGEEELESPTKDEWSDIAEKLPTEVPSILANPLSVRGLGAMAMWQQNMGEYSSTVAEIYRKIATRCVDKGEPERALEFARSMEDGTDTDGILATVAQKLAEKGEIDRGTEVAREIDDAYRRERTLAGLVKQCVLSEEAGRVREMLETVEDPARKTRLLLEVAEVYADAGRRAHAQRVLAQALSLTWMMEKSLTRDWYLGKIADRFVADGQLEKAQGLLEELADPYAQITVLLKIASAQLASRARAVMYETLDEALYIANGIAAPAVRAVALTKIAFLMAKARRTEEASDVLEKALDAAKVMEERFRKSLLSVGEGTGKNEPDETEFMHLPFYDSATESIAMGFAAIGRQSEALRVICEMPPGHRADAIAARLLSRYAEVGRFEAALGLIRMIDDTRERVFALVEIAEKYRQKDQKPGKRAERILHEIVAEIARAQDGATG